jgi:hypothetical protein
VSVSFVVTTVSVSVVVTTVSVSAVVTTVAVVTKMIILKGKKRFLEDPSTFERIH